MHHLKPGSLQPKVIILDDDAAMRLGVEGIVHDEYPSAEIVTCDSWIEANRHLSTARERPRLLMSDINMPGISGAEFCAIVAKRDPDVSIIIMSGDDMSIIRARYKMLANVPIVRKGDGPESLIACVRAAMAALIKRHTTLKPP